LKDDEYIDFDYLMIKMEKENEFQLSSIDDNKNNSNPVLKGQQSLQVTNQLSVSEQQAQPSTVTKKMTTTEPTIKDKISLFSPAKEILFSQTMSLVLGTTTNSITIERLRQIADLIYELASIDLVKSLWTTYLHSGTGKLQIQDQLQFKIDGPSIWPMDVKTTLIREDFTTTRNENELDHHTCLNFTYKYIRDLDASAEKCRTRLSDWKRHLEGFTNELETTIEQFVSEHCTTKIKLTVQAQIKTVEYEYIDRMIELEYLRMKPTEYQVKLFFWSNE
jgi:hypothetical protein